MKKILLSLITVLAFSFQMNAQSTLPFTDDFEGYSVGEDVTQSTSYYMLGNCDAAIVTAAEGDSEGQFVTVTPSPSAEHGMVFKLKAGAAFGGFPNGSFIYTVSIKAQNAYKVKLKMYGDGDNEHHTITQSAEGTCENWTTLEMKFDVFGLDDTTFLYISPVVYSYKLQDIYVDNISIVDEATGITVYNEDFSTVVSPNPSNGVFTIRSDKKIAEYAVINAAGQVVQSVSGLNQKQVEVNLTDQAQGVYMIRVKDNTGAVKVLKEVVR
jgi:hypothetical protein